MYNAEQQIVKALPKLIKASSSDELRTAFENHLEETERHISRLEQAFERLNIAPRGVHCGGMAGILDEGKVTLDDAPDGPALDAAIIGSAQRVEHYEIAAYGTLVEWAKAMGHDDVVGLLDQNLREEKAADQTLTRIAGSGINAAAARQAHA
jgi:ferritin-like metal-binding protein YciE